MPHIELNGHIEKPVPGRNAASIENFIRRLRYQTNTLRIIVDDMEGCSTPELLTAAIFMINELDETVNTFAEAINA